MSVKESILVLIISLISLLFSLYFLSYAEAHDLVTAVYIAIFLVLIFYPANILCHKSNNIILLSCCLLTFLLSLVNYIVEVEKESDNTVIWQNIFNNIQQKENKTLNCK